jgi:hypothetical protein
MNNECCCCIPLSTGSHILGVFTILTACFGVGELVVILIGHDWNFYPLWLPIALQQSF